MSVEIDNYFKTLTKGGITKSPPISSSGSEVDNYFAKLQSVPPTPPITPPVKSPSSLGILKQDIKDVWTQPKAESGKISPEGYLNQVQGWGEDVINSWQNAGSEIVKGASNVDNTGQPKPFVEQAVDLGKAGMSVLNAFFTPITSVFTRAEKAPGVIGQTASFVNKLFGTVGVLGADTGESLVEATPFISQDTKDKITPLVKEISALGAQIVAGKVGGDVYNKLASKTKIVIDKISEDVRIKTLNEQIPKEVIPKVKSAEEFVKSRELSYHGSPTPLKQFHNKNGVFFTNSMEDASGFGGNPDNVYEGHLNFKKPLVIDAKGAKWDELNTKYGKSTQQVISNAQKDGFDGIVFKNIVDNAGDTADFGGQSTVSYAYKPKTSFLNESQLTDFWNKAHETPTAVAPKPIEVKTDTQLNSKVFERMKAENPSLEGELGYDPIKLKADAEKAVELIAKDKQKAYDIAMGKETSTEMTSTGVNIALAEKALQEGNYDLYAKLIKNRSLEQTRRGQEISAERGSVTDNSTARYIKDLIASRLEKLGKSYLGNLKDTLRKRTGKTKATQVIDAEVAKLDKVIRNKKLTAKDALRLLDELACIG